VGADEFVVEGMASTTQVDSFKEIVEPDAFRETLPRYKKFPVVLFAHSFAMPIGKAIKLEIQSGGLWVRVALSKAAGTAEMVRTQIEEGILKAFSIGFWLEMGDIKEDAKRPGVSRITKLELLEISVVPVPANRGAVFGMASAVKDRLGRSVSAGISGEQARGPLPGHAEVHAVLNEVLRSLPGAALAGVTVGSHLPVVGGKA